MFLLCPSVKGHYEPHNKLKISLQEPLPDPIPLKIQFPISRNPPHKPLPDPIPLKIQFPISKGSPSTGVSVVIGQPAETCRGDWGRAHTTCHRLATEQRQEPEVRPHSEAGAPFAALAGAD